jgi:hypothetical protein
MSNTRRAIEGSPLRQERYCSSAEFEQGLLANLVTKRCEVVHDADSRDLIFWLQAQSHKAGGLTQLVKRILAEYPERIGTPIMLAIGVAPGTIYNAEQVRKIRSEIPSDAIWFELQQFPLKGDVQALKPVQSDYPKIDDDDLLGACAFSDYERALAEYHQAQVEAEGFPNEYPVEAFMEVCRKDVEENLEKLLTEFCLNPAVKVDQFAPWFFPDLLATLREFKRKQAESIRSPFVMTEIGKEIFETLDYALETRGMVLVEGLARTGKTYATKVWCELNSGRARYVQVPSTNDDIGFYRAIAQSLGVSSMLSLKAIQLRERVEYVLQTGGIMLVLDEAHYCFPQNNRREALPNRLNWILTAAVNYGVPVALISTHQFTKTQKLIEKKTGWASEQFIGRLSHYTTLPGSLSKDDLTAVARALLPEGKEKAIEALVLYAQGSSKYIAAIESIVKRARFLSVRSGRKEVLSSDVLHAIKQSVIPSDSALASALAEVPVRQKRTALRPVSPPFNDQLNETENGASHPAASRISAGKQPANLSASNRIPGKTGILLEA